MSEIPAHRAHGMRDVVLRPFAPGDEAAIAQVFFSSVRGAALRHYSVEQVTAWAPVPPPPAEVLARALDGRLTLVATDAGELVGYGDLESDGHIDHLYCAPAATGRGVGRALAQALLEAGIAAGMKRFTVEASEAARRTLARLGFVETHRNDLIRDGVALHNYSMVFEPAPDDR